MLDKKRFWNGLLTGAERAKQGAPIARGAWSLDGHELNTAQKGSHLFEAHDQCWSLNRARGDLSEELAEFVALYSPFCSRRSFVVAHLGQSLTGHIATRKGESRFITGAEDVTHNHRLRALSSAVLVGAHTAMLDNPQLTTRLVEGPNPIRVVLDPQLRCPPSLKLFSDSIAPTLVLCANSKKTSSHKHGLADVIAVEDQDGVLSPRSILNTLEEQGIHRIFIEGGGKTVASFLEGDCLDRLHMTVAPTLIGGGRLALPLKETQTLIQALRPQCRHYSFGDDVLFDFDMRAPQRLPLS